MLTETFALRLDTVFSAYVAVESLPMVWQVLAILAVAGLVLVVILAIIEPGPLVKRRPFQRKQRARRKVSNDASESDRESGTVPTSADENLSQGERGRRHVDGHSGGV